MTLCSFNLPLILVLFQWKDMNEDALRFSLSLEGGVVDDLNNAAA